MTRPLPHPDTLRLAAVIESSDDAIISHALDGTIETWNRAAERMFGHTSAEAIGRHIHLIIPASRRFEEDEAIRRLRAGTIPSHFESVGVSRRRGAHIADDLTCPEPRRRRHRDVAHRARHRAAEGDRARDYRLAAIVDSSEDAIASKDLNGIVQTWNKAAERMFGHLAAEIVGRHISLIIPAERLSEEDRVLSAIRAGRSIEHFETVRQRKDGSRVEISLSVSPIKTPTAP